ncbi:MAG: hypothetical protein ACXAD7_17670 [Candidatus Kariarchaeaceae archaeon]|jgi:hypothetical protein
MHKLDDRSAFVDQSKKRVQKHINMGQFVAEHQNTTDEERERKIRFIKFAGFVLVLVIIWYVFDFAGTF